MRPLKFRIWDSDQNRILPVITMYYDEDGRQWFGFQRSEAGPEPASMEYCEAHIDDPTVAVMQFSGLYDRNGREIYEGDIVQFVECHNAFGEKATCISREVIDMTYSRFDDGDEGGPDCRVWYEEIEVIGNIHESPELLE